MVVGTACCVIINFDVEQFLDLHFFVTVALISTFAKLEVHPDIAPL